MVSALFAFGLSTMLIAPVHAAPDQLPFSARLTTPSGTNVPDGTYSVTFRLYTVASGGSAVWTEAHSLVVTKGEFAAYLGDTTPLTGIDFTQTLFLGFSVESDPEMVPRYELGSVPSALNADKLDNLDSTSFFQKGLNETVTGNTIFSGTATFNNSSTFTGGVAIQPAALTGNALLVNTAAGFVGNLIDLQLNGSDKLTVDQLGNFNTQGSITSADALTVLAGGATIAGGLTVGDSGITVTGDSLVTGNFQVTGVTTTGGLTSTGQYTNSFAPSVASSGWAIAAQGAPLNTPNSALVAIGNGSFTGVGADTFVGSNSGTLLGVNSAVAFAGNLVDFQTAGTSVFKATAAGQVTTAGALTILSGGLTVSSGGFTVTGNSTLTGTLGGLTGLTVASGGASITGGLTVVSGGANITGDSTITGDLTLSANKSLKLTGGTSFPGTPTEGQVFFRTDTKLLYVYSNGQWQADRSTATEVVATANTQNKEKADFVGNGTSDQTAINAAIAALPAGGGLVYLLDGTYTATATITIAKSNVALVGAGKSTILKRGWNNVTSDSGVVTVGDDTSAYTGVTLSNFAIDGVSGSYAGSYNHGVAFLEKVSQSQISDLSISNVTQLGIYFKNTGVGKDNNYNKITGNDIVSASAGGIDIEGGTGNLITGNTITSSGLSGSGAAIGINKKVGAVNAFNTTISNNILTANSIGIYAISNGGVNNTTGISMTGNIVTNSVGDAIDASCKVDDSVISGNTLSSNGGVGINNAGASRNTISGNVIRDNGGSGASDGIVLSFFGGCHSSDNNLVTNNTITDTAGTGHAIDIYSGGSANNIYLANNYFSGTGAADIFDGGTNTIWAGQMDGSGNILTKNAGVANINGLAINGSAVVTAGTWQGSTVTEGYGGTGISNYTSGDLLYATGATTLSQLSIAGSAGLCLVSNGSNPAWGSCAGTGSGSTLQATYTNGNTIDTTTGNDLAVTLHPTSNFTVNISTGNTGKFSVQNNGTDTFKVTSTTTTINGSGGLSVSNGINNNAGGITNTGAISGATTINATGTITGGTLTDGTLSITSGAVTGATTIAASGKATLSGTGANELAVTGAPAASATSSLVQLGSAIVAGSTAGTYLGINSGSGFTGNFVDYQVNGTSKFSVDYQGNANFSGALKLGNQSFQVLSGSATNQGPSGSLYFGKTKLTSDVFDESLYNFGNLWVAKDSSRWWYGVAMSADGSRQTAVENGGQIYISSDYGNTWTAKDSNRNWTNVAMSADGSRQTAVVTGGQIYVSADYGNTWTAKDSNRTWQGVAMSADGLHQTATNSSGNIYISSDYGNTWTAKDSSRQWWSVAMSADGSRQTAVVNFGQVYISSDYGNTWTAKLSSQNWQGVAMSSDGSRQTITLNGGNIYVSTDYGSTWTSKASSHNWYATTMSADGARQAAVAGSGGQIYISSDYGNTWTAKDSGRSWLGIAMSADGSRQTATVQGGQIYVSVAEKSSQLANLILNPASSFTGNIIDAQLAGSSKFSVTEAGAATIANGLTITAGGLTVTGNSTITGTLGGLTGLTVVSGGANITGDSTITGDLTLSANKSLKLTGGTSFPGTPTEGQVFFRTDTKLLYVYSNGQWQADRSTATEIVATANTQNKEKADFVGNGTSDQTAINAAISALPAGGGLVYLLDGTYTVTAPVSITKSNVTLMGVGSAAIVKRGWNEGSDYLSGLVKIGNGTNAYANIRVTNLAFDGNKATYSAGIYNNNLSLADNLTNVTVDSLSSTNAKYYGLLLDSGSFSNARITISNNFLSSNGSGIYSGGPGSQFTISGNTVTGSSWAEGIRVDGYFSSPVTDLTVSHNNILTTTSGNGAELQNIVNGTFTGNTVDGSAGTGLNLTHATHVVVSGNGIANSGNPGIEVSSGSTDNLITGNVLFENDSDGIRVDVNSNNNTITDNQITATAGTGFAINIWASQSGMNLSNNYFSGTGASSISDSGTNTIWANQMDGSGNLVTKGMNINQNGLAINTSGQVTAGTWQGSTVTAGYGGTGQSTYTAGDMLYATAGTTLSKLAIGSSGNCLIVSSGAPAWGSCSGTGSGSTLQAAYDNGNTIATSDARDLTVTLADTATDANFKINIATGSTGKFAVQNNGTDILSVNTTTTTIASGGLAVTGNSSVTGTFLSTGLLTAQSGLTVSGGNLAVSSGTITASGNINSTGGSIQTNSTTRIDNSGNLSNIGTIAASGNTTLSGTGANELAVTGAPAASATSSLVQLGSAIVGGSTAGTYLGINSGSGFTGNFVDYQVNGTSKFSVDYQGNANFSGSLKLGNQSFQVLSGSATNQGPSGSLYFGKTKLTTDVFDESLYNFGSLWVAKDSSRGWYGVAMSADGSHQTSGESGGQIYISSDYGNTWTAKDSNRSWRGIAISADGSRQTAVVSSGQIYISSDYGNTWTAKDSNRAWQAVAMSADGSRQTATVVGGQIYISSDYGNTWTAKDSNRGWQAVAMSADGSRQTAVAAANQIFVSTDYGNTWTAKDSFRNWHGVAMSADGSRQTAVVSSGQIYISSDYGNTWTAKDSSRNWNSVAMSADGARQAAIAVSDQIYVSTDYGNTWAPKDSSRFWNAVAMSADGTRQTAVPQFSQIYVSITEKTTQLANLILNPASSFSGNIIDAQLAGSSKFSVTQAGVATIAGGLTVTAGGITLSAGNLAVNAGTITASGNINTTGGSIQTNSTTRIDNSGNLSNIGTIAASGAATLSGTGANELAVTGAPAASATSSLVQLGSAIVGGSTAGTYLGINSGSGFTGNFVDYQVNGTSKFSVDYQGNANFSGSLKLGNQSFSVLSGSAANPGPSGSLYFGKTKLTSDVFDESLYNFGSLWVAKDSSRTWRSVAMSADGSRQTAVDGSISGGFIYISSDYGNTWAPKGTSQWWTAVSMSADGRYQTAVANSVQIYISSDYGNTWTAKASAATWTSVTMSADGRYQTAAQSGNKVYVSSDYGNTWTAKGSSDTWYGVAMSADGSRQTAVANGGQIYISTDYGNTWAAKDSSRNWRNVAMSSDGARQTAVENNGQIYISTDYGNTWVAKDSNRAWWVVAMSADGARQVAGMTSGNIYTSSDYGNTWVARGTSQSWLGVAISADGSRMTGAANSDFLYTSVAEKTTQLANLIVNPGSTFTGNLLDAQLAGASKFSVTQAGAATIANGLTITAGGLTVSAGGINVNSTGITNAGAIAGATSITASGTIQGATINGTTDIQLNGTSINTAGTLSNVAYKNAANIFTLANSFTASGTALSVTNDASIGGQLILGGEVLQHQSGTAANPTDQLFYGRSPLGVQIQNESNQNFGSTWIAKDSVRNWQAVAMSADGSRQTAVVSGGQIYTSTDFGNTWTAKDSSRSWTGVAMSADGSRQTATVNGGQIYISTDFGNTWTAKDSSRGWYNVAMSADGHYQTAVVYGGGQIYTSSDYGNTWTPEATGLNWYSVAMSADGKYQTATPSGDQIYVSSDYGITWTAKDSARGWYAVAMSADGSRQTAVADNDQIYVSVDHGSTWAAVGASKQWRSVAVSANGARQAATTFGGQSYFSTDYGTTWAAKGPSVFALGIAMSADGTYMAVAANSQYMYISITEKTSYAAGLSVTLPTDSTGSLLDLATAGSGSLFNVSSGGVVTANGSLVVSNALNNQTIWNPKGPSSSMFAIAVSSDGSRQTAVGYDQIYVSTDYGNTWAAKDSSRSWQAVAMSSDGQYQSATVASGQIYVSSDYGSTWTAKDSSRAWSGIAMSSDGTYQTAVVQFGQIYVSSDHGNTWAPKDSSRGWHAVAMSADGAHQTATTLFGLIYISSDHGATWTGKDSSRYWYSVAMSADGVHQTAVDGNSGLIYVSADSGSTWTSKASAQAWYSVAVSSDASHQTAVVNGGQIYISTDTGNTWTAKGNTHAWGGVAMSADATYQTAVAGKIYVLGILSPALVVSAGGASVTGGLTVAGGLTVSSGGINNNAGGITNAGAIAGATTIAANNTLTLSGTGANELAVTGTPATSTTSSLVQLGSAIASGSAAGTYLGINSGSGFTGNLVDVQKNGVSVLALSSTLANFVIADGGSDSANAFCVTTARYNRQMCMANDGILTNNNGFASSSGFTISGAGNVHYDATSLYFGTGTSDAGFNRTAAGVIRVTNANAGGYATLQMGQLVVGSGYGGSSAPSDGAIIQGNVGIGTTTTTNGVLTVHKGSSGTVFAIRDTTDSSSTFTITDAGVVAAAGNISTSVANTGFSANSATYSAFQATGTPSSSATQSLIQLGSAIVGGSTAGTYLGINSGSGFTGNFVDYQVNGTSKFSVDYQGNANFSGSLKLGNQSFQVLSGSATNQGPSGSLYFGKTKLTSDVFDESLYNFGNLWVARDSSRGWESVAMSADGSRQTAVAWGGQIYISTDYGATWTAKDSNRSWWAVAMSADGAHQAAVGNSATQIYVSSDYGNTWTAKASSAGWGGIAMSADGRYQTAVRSGGQIYISSDYGNNWAAKGASTTWTSVAMSADGSRQTAIDSSNLLIYVSSDYGNTWNSTGSGVSYYEVAMSSDGARQTAVANSGQIYISTDYGATWTAKDSSRAWHSIAMSADGARQVAVVNSGQIYVSTDYGNTWAAKDSSRAWYGVAMSADGTRTTAVVQAGQIYTSVSEKTTQLANLILNPASTFSGNIIDAQLAGSSKFSVTQAGAATIANGLTLTAGNLAVSSGTITSSGNINTTGGSIQTNSTTRIDNSGNLSNIGTIAASGKATLSGTGANELALTGAPAASATSSLVQLGSAIVGGSTAGTYLGINSGSGFTGNFVDYQVNGTSKFSVDYQGNANFSGSLKLGNQSFQVLSGSATNQGPSGSLYFGKTKLTSDVFDESLYGFGNLWVAKDSSRGWVNVASSADGSRQTAIVTSGQIYISSDYGNTWTAKDSSRVWSGNAMSADGSHQTAVVNGGQIYISSDYGNTWTAKDSNRSWLAVAMSADGSRQTAVVNGSGLIYVSTDYGNTWTSKASSNPWWGIAMSADGSHQTAFVQADQIYISSDYGNTWTGTGYTGAWRSVAVSADGARQSAVTYLGQIYVSTDYGVTWTAKDSSRTWLGIAMSADGARQAATEYGGNMYISSDYGNTWTAKDSTRNWYKVAMSADGTRLVSVVNGGQIYTSTAEKTTQLANLILNPASSFSGNIIDAQLAGSSKFSVTQAGVATIAGGLTVTAGGITLSAGNLAVNAGTITASGNINTTSGVIQTNSTTRIDNSGVLSNVTYQGATVTEGYGGTGQSTYTAGDTLYATAGTTLSKLAIGGIGTCLVSTGSAPSWGSCASGGAYTLQAVYNAGSTITTNDAQDLAVTLANTATDSNFLINIATGSTGKFAVQNNGTDVLTVTSSAITAAANLTVSSGDLAVSSGTITSSGNINSTGGSIETNSTVRIDNSGNLTNIGNITGTAGVNLQATSGTLALSATGSNIITFATNATERMRIDANGLLGLNNNAPVALFDAVGQSGTSSGAITMSGSNGGSTLTTSSSITLSVGDYIIPTTTTAQARAISVGGTGTSFTVSPAFTGNVTTETFTIYHMVANLAVNGGTSALSVQGSTGYVGIGTTAPTSKLHVVDGSGYLTFNQSTGLTIHQPGGAGDWTASIQATGSGAIYVPIVKTGTVYNAGGNLNINTGNSWIIKIGNGSQTQSSGTQIVTDIVPQINQTSTAGYTALRISPYEQGTGSGTKLLIDAGTDTAANGGGTHTSKFSVDDNGNTNIASGATFQMNGTSINTAGTLSNVAYLNQANTFTAAQTNSTNGAVSTPAQVLTGTWYSGGSSTTTKPQVLIQPTGATSNNWSTSGTGFGVNAAAAFAGNLADLQVDGTREFAVDASGNTTINGALKSASGNLAIQAASGIVAINTASTQNYLRVYDSSGTNYAQLTNDGTNTILSSSSGSVQIQGSGTDQFILGQVGTSVDLVFAENSSIKSAGSKAISLGASGDIINLNVSGVTYNVGTLSAANTILNTSATGSTAMVINGPSGLTANILDLQVNSSSKFSVSKDGNTAASGYLTAASGRFGTTGTPTGKLDVIGAATGTANYGTLNIGAAATSFDGSTSGFFAGSSSGTQLAVNAGNTFAGSLADFQINGVSKLVVSYKGAITVAPATDATALTVTQPASATADAVAINNASAAAVFTIDVLGKIASGESIPGVPIVGVDPNSGSTVGDLVSTSGPLKGSYATSTLTISAGAAYTANAATSQTAIRRCYWDNGSTLTAGAANTYYIEVLSNGATSANGQLCTLAAVTALPTYNASKPVLVIGVAVSDGANWTSYTDTRFFIGGTLVYVNMPASSTYGPGFIVKTDTSADNGVITSTSGADTPLAGVIVIGQTTGGSVGQAIMMTSGSAWTQAISTAARGACAGTSTTAGKANNVTAAVNACVGRMVTSASATALSALVQVSPN